MAKGRYIVMMLVSLLIILSFISGCVEQTNTDDEKTEEPNVLLTVLSNDYQSNYTLEELESLESYTGTGRYIKTKLLNDSIVISDSIEYTGIRMTTLLDEIPNLADNYTVSVMSEDGWILNFTKNQTLGYVDVYNETADILPSETAVMLLAYKEDGLYYSEIDPDHETGPLRLAFVDDEVITSSNLWSKMVVSISIIPE